METGIVKWFNDAKGFGFITPDAGIRGKRNHARAPRAAGVGAGL